MTLTEKRERLMKVIQNLPEEAVDKLLASVSTETEVEPKAEADKTFEKYLDETTRKYKKVWEALS